MTEMGELPSKITVGYWQSKDIHIIHTQLEVPNWAPWLAAQQESLAGRADVFAKGQLVVKSANGIPLASLSMNKINWDGNSVSLPSWDEVAGDPTTYEQTYIPEGNTLSLMSMNVHPLHQGEGYARKLIEHARNVAIAQNVDYLIGSFRPNQFGEYKLGHLNEETTFEMYCELTRPDGLPLDSWIRNLTRNGMQPLCVDPQAMVVAIPLDEFSFYKENHKPGLWQQVAVDMWECGEVGNWTIDEEVGSATYKESNLWGILWKKNGLQ